MMSLKTKNVLITKIIQHNNASQVKTAKKIDETKKKID